MPYSHYKWLSNAVPFSDSLGNPTREGNGTPLQHSCLESPMDGGAWWAAVHGVAESWTRLSDFTFTFHFSFSCIGEGNGNPLQYSCLENPGDGGAWWAAVYGVAQNWTWLKWLSSSSTQLLYKGTPEESQFTWRWFYGHVKLYQSHSLLLSSRTL